MGIIAKIYPNGETSLYFERKKKPDSIKRDRQKYLDFSELHAEAVADIGGQAAYAAIASTGGAKHLLGLVTAPNSTKTPKTLNKARGLTRHGARVLRNAAWTLEREYGKDQITFLTATVPSVTDEELDYIHAEWHNIVHRFIKRLRYRLQQCGLMGGVIHVTEIQSKRWQTTGQDVPHLHVVFQGRKRKKSWAITPKMVTKWWKAALQLPSTSTRTYTTSCQLARVKYSVSRYLSKYVAKSRGKTEGATSQSTSRKQSIRRWWGCTNWIRRLLTMNTLVRVGSLAEKLWRTHEEEDRRTWEFQGAISNTWNGITVVFCRFGRLTENARQKYLRPILGIDKPGEIC